MPVILAPADYARWLGEEPDPRDLMRPFPAEPMRMWPIFDARQQARERRPVHRGACRTGNGRGVG